MCKKKKMLFVGAADESVDACGDAILVKVQPRRMRRMATSKSVALGSPSPMAAVLWTLKMLLPRLRLRGVVVVRAAIAAVVRGVVSGVITAVVVAAAAAAVRGVVVVVIAAPVLSLFVASAALTVAVAAAASVVVAIAMETGVL